MKTEVQYNDFRGSVSADVSDTIGGTSANALMKIAEYFELDSERFILIGLSIRSINSLELRCIDKEKSKNKKEYIVDLNIDLQNQNVFDILFKRIHISLHSRYDDKYLDTNLESNTKENIEKY